MDRVGADFFAAVQSMVDRLGAKAVPIQLPIGTEEHFRGVVDVVEMQGVVWDDALGMEPKTIEIPTELQEQAEAYHHQLIDAVADERAAGYRSAMRRHGLGGEVAVQACDFSEDAGYAAAAALLGGGRRRPVTALAAVNDLAAVGALSAAADAGVAPPGGLAVTGYDDTFLAEIRQLSLTSVNPDSAGIGELAARHLVQRIAAPDRPAVERLVPPRLVVRASSSRPAHGPDEADRSTGRGPGGAGPVSGHRPEEAAR
jgi:ABC-type sugar transport system substrate-binding protein